MKNVLVTGADGFIGKSLVDKLLSENNTVYAVVYPGSTIYNNYNHVNLKVKHIDLHKIMNFTDDFPPDIDTLYHFAWSGVGVEFRNNLDIQISNIDMTMNCIKFSNKIGIKRIIFPGSTNEYLYYGKPLNNRAIPSPSNIYGAVKVALRYLCESYSVVNNLEFIYTIITGIYSERRKDNNVIFYTIDRLLHKEKPSLTKLDQLWDYVYIDDVVDALISIGQKGKNGAVYAIGHGDNWPLINYIKIIHQIIDPTLPLGIGEKPYPNNKMPSSCIDLTDLEKDTGFKPKIDFHNGITKVINKLKLDMDKK